VRGKNILGPSILGAFNGVILARASGVSRSCLTTRLAPLLPNRKFLQSAAKSRHHEDILPLLSSLGTEYGSPA